MSLHISNSSIETKYFDTSVAKSSEGLDGDFRPMPEEFALLNHLDEEDKKEWINDERFEPDPPLESNESIWSRKDIAGEVHSIIKIKECQTKILPPSKYVRWGVPWKKPGIIVSFVFSGVLSILAHHIYYHSLDGSVTGDVERQQWPGRFGTAFAFLVSSSLVSAAVASFNQYTWIVFRRKGLTLRSLDSLQGLPTDPSAFFNMELLRRAPMAIFLGLISWCLPLSALAPPASLSVVLVVRDLSANQILSQFNWTGPWYFTDDIITRTVPASPVVLEIANLAAQTMSMQMLPNPYPNSSYRLEFFGPTVQCLLPNEMQNAAFAEASRLAWDFTPSLNASFLPTVYLPGWVTPEYASEVSHFAGLPLLVYTSWSPFLSLPAGTEVNYNGSFSFVALRNSTKNTLNNWIPTLNIWKNRSSTTLNGQKYQEIWIKTTTQNIICSLANATFMLELKSVNGIQNIVSQEVRVLNNSGWGFTDPSVSAPSFKPYNAVFSALSSILNGNLTISYGISGAASFAIEPPATNTVLTGLITCDEIVHNFWETGSHTIKDLPSSSGSLFGGDPWMCRNRSLARAVEDLANNITISMLSSPNLTQPGTTPVSVNALRAVNVYQYNPRTLIISYSIGLFFAFFAVTVGLASFATNGINHSTSFSAMIATTRNRKLDKLMEGYSLGDPLEDEKIGKTKLKFGAIEGEEGGREKSGEEKHVRRVAWGLEGDVTTLEKGGLYV